MIKAEVFSKLGRLNNEIENLLKETKMTSNTVIAIIAILFFVTIIITMVMMVMILLPEVLRSISDVKKKHLGDSKDGKKTHI